MLYRVVFFGTAAFSVPLLQGLKQDARFQLVGVVTQPDRPTGRKGLLTPPPTKIAAETLGIPVYQFENVKDDHAFKAISELKADVFAVASFGQILPQALLDLAPYGAINFHWSLLPKYRGASPVQAAIIHGDKKIGATIIRMDAKMDRGDILSFFEEDVRSEDTADTLYHRLGQKGSTIFPTVLAEYIEGKILPQAQKHEEASFVKLITREDGRLEPTQKTATELERLIRAYQPWPGTYLEIEGKRLKVLSGKEGTAKDIPAGSRFVEGGLPAVACKEGTSLILTSVQPEGKQAMEGKAYLLGKKDWTS